LPDGRGDLLSQSFGDLLVADSSVERCTWKHIVPGFFWVLEDALA
jgi:hypothetical protein